MSDGFPRGLIFNHTELVTIDDSSEGDGAIWPDNIMFLQQDLPNYQKLDNQKCKKAYAQHFIRDRGDVVVVTRLNTPDTNTSTVLGGTSAGWGPWPYQWLCPPGTQRTLACYGELSKSSDT